MRDARSIKVPGHPSPKRESAQEGIEPSELPDAPLPPDDADEVEAAGEGLVRAGCPPPTPRVGSWPSNEALRAERVASREDGSLGWELPTPFEVAGTASAVSPISSLAAERARDCAMRHVMVG